MSGDAQQGREWGANVQRGSGKYISLARILYHVNDRLLLQIERNGNGATSGRIINTANSDRLYNVLWSDDPLQLLA